MKLSAFRDHLVRNSGRNVAFVLPDGRHVPAHAHVTEVARIDKRFIDCGGTLRTETYCRLQVWVADDLDHRLGAGKLAAILDKASSFLGTDDHEVDVEYEDQVISQYPVTAVDSTDGPLAMRLTTRHTDCLARDLCTPAVAQPQAIAFKAFATLR